MINLVLIGVFFLVLLMMQIVISLIGLNTRERCEKNGEEYQEEYLEDFIVESFEKIKESILTIGKK